MRAIKMAVGTLSLLMFVICFAAAVPMVQQQKTSPSDEKTNQVTSPPKPDKKLNFIQKFILKKARKKMKKVSDEDKYRGWAELSVLFGVFTAFLWIIGLVVSIVLGAKALKKSQDKRTRILAGLGILIGILLFVLMTILILNAPVGIGFPNWSGW